MAWVSCTGNVWCGFRRVNLETANLTGVYVIFAYQNNKYVTIYVGSGTVNERIQYHRDYNKEIAAQEKIYGDLYVTWHAVDGRSVENVELYLAQTLRPIVGNRHPNVTPKSIVLPY